METSPAKELKKTPMDQVHRDLGGKMVDFGGWDMPVQYTGIIEEHRRVRGAVGLFDVSHMGELEVEGPGALAALTGVDSPSVLLPGVGSAVVEATVPVFRIGFAPA